MEMSLLQTVEIISSAPLIWRLALFQRLPAAYRPIFVVPCLVMVTLMALAAQLGFIRPSVSQLAARVASLLQTIAIAFER